MNTTGIKALSTLAIAAIAGIGLVGCSGQSDTPAQSAPSVQAEKPAETAAPATTEEAKAAMDVRLYRDAADDSLAYAVFATGADFEYLAYTCNEDPKAEDRVVDLQAGSGHVEDLGRVVQFESGSAFEGSAKLEFTADGLKLDGKEYVDDSIDTKACG